MLVVLHLAAAMKGRALDRELAGARSDGFVEACRASEIRDKRARIVSLAGERVAIFRYDGKLSAVSNVCQHQNGPLGEGRILDGCITCPWHGYQYRPADGRSPEPFTERVPTFRLRLVDGDRVFVDPKPLPAGTFIEPVELHEKSSNKGGDAGSETDEFFVGYLPVPPRLARFARGVAIAIVVAFGAMAALLASAQRPLGKGEFDFAVESTWRGLLTTSPVPGIWPQGDSAGAATPLTGVFFPLVGEGKHGAPEVMLAAAHQLVELRGHRIERFGQQMVETTGVLPASVASPPATPAPVSLGRARLRGEIVDSKCYYGVMKPAAGKSHRDCAVRCISGGAPPAFVVRSPDERVVVLLLVGADGASIARDVLDLVAEPVEIDGEVSRVGDRLVLAADPASIRRIGG
jgi:nitrite reductase/ring-hydroxylating ferredoxin subunit